MIMVGIFGAGGYAREVMPVARQTVMRNFECVNDIRLVFVVPQGEEGGDVNGHSIISETDFFSVQAEKKYFNVAIADSRLRQRIAEKAMGNGVAPLEMCADNCIKLDNNEIAIGGIFSPSVIVTSNAKIGRFFHANIFSYIAHDCVIGDFVTFAPNVHCNGNVIIKDHAYIGTGAVLKQGSKESPLIIGEGAVVGMGAIVTKNVPPYTTVVGNPARPLVKQ